MVNREELGLQNYLQGEDFQDEIAMSWAKVPGAWRMRIRDGGNGDRPADEIVVLEKFRVLVELKRTKSNTFNLRNLVKENQIKGLLAFDRLNYYNLGVLIINFTVVDQCYIVRIEELLKYIKKINKFSVKRSDFETKKFKVIQLQRNNNVWCLTKLEKSVGELYESNY